MGEEILLVEDRISRMNQYFEGNIKDYPIVKLYTPEDFTALKFKLDNNELLGLDDYKCIIVHASSMDANQKDKLKEYCKNKVKSLVFFSGSISSNIYIDTEFPFLNINAKFFYQQGLKYFLDNYSSSNVNLQMLQFGGKWELNLFVVFRNLLVQELEKEYNRIKNTNDQVEVIIDSDLIVDSVGSRFIPSFDPKKGTITLLESEIKDILKSITRDIFDIVNS